MRAVRLYRRAQSLGLCIETDGRDLLVKPGNKCPPDLAKELKEHKAELMNFLLFGAILPWLHVAIQIMAGEFDGADDSTRESLTIGLRRSSHQTCQAAVHKLWPNGVPKHLQV